MKYWLLPLFILFMVSCDEVPETPEPVAEELAQTEKELTPIDSINALIIRNPTDPQLFLNRAKMYRDMDSLEQAMLDVQRVIRIDSTLAEVHYVEGDILYRSRAVDLAMDEFEKCLEYDPEYVPCLLRKAEIDMLLRNYEDALKVINTALRVDEFQPEAYYMKGLLYKETGDTNLAVSSYITATELDPNYYDAFIQIGLLYADATSDLALEYFNSALDIYPGSVEALYAKAIYLQSSAKGRDDRLREALDIYYEIDELDPTNAASAFNRGYIYLEYMMKYDSAAIHFSEAIDRYPSYFQAYYNRGLSFESLGDEEKALQDYNRSLGLKPDYTPAAIAKSRVLEN